MKLSYFWPHTSPYLEWDDQKEARSIVQTNEFYIITEKYPLECVFVYNLVSPNVSLFLPESCCIFM